VSEHQTPTVSYQIEYTKQPTPATIRAPPNTGLTDAPTNTRTAMAASVNPTTAHAPSIKPPPCVASIFSIFKLFIILFFLIIPEPRLVRLFCLPCAPRLQNGSKQPTKYTKVNPTPHKWGVAYPPTNGVFLKKIFLWAAKRRWYWW